MVNYESIRRLLPRNWSRAISFSHGINDSGIFTPIRLKNNGALKMAAAPNHTNFYAYGASFSEPSGVIIAASTNNSFQEDYSDLQGWIDVREFSKFSLTVFTNGHWEKGAPEAGVIQTLTLDSATVKVEYRNHTDEPKAGELASVSIGTGTAYDYSGQNQKELNDLERYEIASPALPKDISNVGWIRIRLQHSLNANGGDCVMFGTLS